MKLKRIAVLCSDEPHHNYLIYKLLEANFNVKLIVIEPSKYKMKRLINRKKYKDFFYSVYHNIRRNILRYNRYRKKYFELPNESNLDEKIKLNKELQVINVEDINSQEVSNKLAELKPDITIIIGVSILGLNVINSCNNNIINIHGGYLPYYRGNHCFFFAMYNRDFDKIGSTIHYVDKGIDTGDIIEHIKPSIKKSDNAETLYCRAGVMSIY